MKFIFLRNYKPVYISFAILVFIYIILIAYRRGGDIDVYLNASRELFNKENIYAPSTYNNYLYSPLFALLLRPISIFDFRIARIIWAIINLIVTFRLWRITYNLIHSNLKIDSKLITVWTIGVIFISFGFLNLNFKLGQITMILLWLTFEGLYQIIIQNKRVSGAILLAIGITIKILPLIGLFYLAFKGRFKAMTICMVFIITSLLLPSIIIGHEYNLNLLHKWAEIINPQNSHYVFEDYNKGTQSLNAILPIYFFNSENAATAPSDIKPQIAVIPYDTLVIIMQILRVTFLFSSLLLIFYHFSRRENKEIYFYWETSYLALISALIFPHQQTYSMLYFVPAGSYMILFILLGFLIKWKIEFKYKVIAMLASFLMIILAIQGRDILGVYLYTLFETFKGYGLINMVFLIFLILIKPNLLIGMNNQSKLAANSYKASKLHNKPDAIFLDFMSNSDKSKIEG